MEATEGWEPSSSDSREENAVAGLDSMGHGNEEQRERKRLRQKSTLSRSIPVTEAGRGPFGSAVWWQPEQLTLQKLTLPLVQNSPFSTVRPRLHFTLHPWTQLTKFLFYFGLVWFWFIVVVCLFFWSFQQQICLGRLWDPHWHWDQELHLPTQMFSASPQDTISPLWAVG